MPTSKEDLIKTMPREQLESIVIDATKRYASLQTELDRTRTESSNWRTEAQTHEAAVLDADKWIGFLLMFSVIEIIFIILLATGVI